MKLVPIKGTVLGGLPVIVSGIVFWGMVLVGLFAIVFISRQEESALRHEIELNALVLSGAIEELLEYGVHDDPLSGNRSALIELVNEQMPKRGFQATRLADGGDEIIIGTIPPQADSFSLSLAVRLRSGGAADYPVDVQFYYPNFDQTMTRKRNELFVTIGAVVFLFGVILQQILQRVLSKPIMNMVAVASRFSAGDTQLRFDEGRRDELGYMAKFINNALDNLINEQRATREVLQHLSDSQRALQEQHDLLEVRVQERTEALRAANKELEAYSYSIAHDLRQPLRAIDGFSLLLLEDFRDRLDEEGQGHIRRVREAAQRMGRLIDDMLQLSKITRSEVVYRDVNLSVEAAAVVEHLRATQPERRVTVEIGECMPRKADPGLVRIILDNLLGNAWKYSAENPAARIEFNCTDMQGVTVYYVSDNGVGFDETYSDKLFRPFERLHSERRFKGTGIGLATVARAVQRMGGEVWAESRIGEGATFYFTLALDARHPPASIKQ
jgi:signal transduction histidine kinase